MKRVRRILVGGALLFGAGVLLAGEPRLLYSTRNMHTSALGWDVAGDTALEWVETKVYGPSVLRRVNPDGSAGQTLIEMEGEAKWEAGPASIDYLQVPAEGAAYALLPFSANGAGICIRVVRQESGKRGRIIVSTDTYDEAAGIPRIASIEGIRLVGGRLAVVGHRDRSQASNLNAFTATTVFSGDRMVAEIAGHVVGESGGRAMVCGPGDEWRALGEAASAQALALAAPVKVPGNRWLYKELNLGGRRFQWRGTEGRVSPLEGGQVQAAGAGSGGAQEERLLPKGCANDVAMITGMWQTRRGTIVLAVESSYIVTDNGRWVYGGDARCLFEVQ